MKSTFFATLSAMAVAVIMFSSFSSSAQIPDIKTTKVEGETYRCLQHGGGFALKTTDPQRLWQVGTETNGKMSSEGIELDIAEFRRARCPHCFLFDAVLKVGKQTMDYKININRVGDGIKLDATISSNESEDKEQRLNLNCEFVSQK